MDEFYEALLPWVDREKLLIRKKAFTPSERKYIGEICYGIELMPLCDTYDFIPLSMRILKVAADLYPNDFELCKSGDGQMHISRVTGSHEMERVLEGKKDRQPSDGMGRSEQGICGSDRAVSNLSLKLLELAEVSLDDKVIWQDTQGSVNGGYRS